MIRANVSRKRLEPKHVFRIARAHRPYVENIFLTLEQNGFVGYGEASPNRFFGEDAEAVHMRLSGLVDFFRSRTLQSFSDIEIFWEEIWEQVAPSRACQCAVDIALWDLWSKLINRTANEIVHGHVTHPLSTSATLGICEMSEWQERISEVTTFDSVKVKMDATADLGLLHQFRKSYSKALRVDANCAWEKIDMESLSLNLKKLGVEFIEQPFSPEQDQHMEKVLPNSHLPIFADESCKDFDDIPSLVDRFSGFNIKLVKCGGITPALKMLALGKKLGLKTMVGCMLESSLLISAGTLVAQTADFCDLDGSWLLKNDPFEGLEILNGKIYLVWAPGLGTSPKGIEEIF